jgi:hypothetical protein
MLAHIECVILLWQSSNPAFDYRKKSAITRDDLRQEGVEFFHAEGKYGAR